MQTYQGPSEYDLNAGDTTSGAVGHAMSLAAGLGFLGVMEVPALRKTAWSSLKGIAKLTRLGGQAGIGATKFGVNMASVLPAYGIMGASAGARKFAKTEFTKSILGQKGAISAGLYADKLIRATRKHPVTSVIGTGVALAGVGYGIKKMHDIPEGLVQNLSEIGGNFL